MLVGVLHVTLLRDRDSWLSRFRFTTGIFLTFNLILGQILALSFRSSKYSRVLPYTQDELKCPNQTKCDHYKYRHTDDTLDYWHNINQILWTTWKKRITEDIVKKWDFSDLMILWHICLFYVVIYHLLLCCIAVLLSIPLGYKILERRLVT